MDNLLGDYGIMDASEQEQDFYMSIKGLQSIVGDDRSRAQSVWMAGHSECTYASQLLAPVGGGYLEEVG